MARPDPWRLDPDRYPHRSVIQTRFGDLDPLGHINNVAMAALFESARVRFNHDAGLLPARGGRWLVARVEVNYLAEGRFPADVVMATGIGSIGTRSWTILAAAFQHGQPIATCDTVVVLSSEGGATALPGALRTALEAQRVTEG